MTIDSSSLRQQVTVGLAFEPQSDSPYLHSISRRARPDLSTPRLGHFYFLAPGFQALRRPFPEECGQYVEIVGATNDPEGSWKHSFRFP